MLTATDRTLARLSVAICLGDWSRLRELRLGTPEGEPDRRWREAVLQAHLFCGLPRVVEAWGVLEAAGGLGAPGEDEARHQGERFEAGRELFDRIYSTQAEAVRETLEHYHPVLARWIEGHAYGRVLSRPGLAADRRELLAVACLAALGQDRQLASHARGAVFVGASAADLSEVLDAIQDQVDDAHLKRARRVLDRFAR